MAKKSKKKSKKPGWIDWAKCQAKWIILDDLAEGFVSLDAKEDPAESVWEYYRDLPEFSGPPVVFEQFKERLRDHRKQVLKCYKRSKREMEALAHDRALPGHERTDVNKRGELVFDLHPAKLLLWQDVLEEKHKGMFPSEFQATRFEYMLFDSELFKGRIYQEERRLKWMNFMARERKRKRNQLEEEQEPTI